MVRLRSARCGLHGPCFRIHLSRRATSAKVYDVAFSAGQKGEIEQRRIDQQLALRGHDCAFLVQVFEGGKFDNRLYLLMSRAPGTELEQRLPNIPRNKVRHIMDQIAKAAIFLRGKNLCHRDIKAANIFMIVSKLPNFAYCAPS
jgi:serine/threonine protein kinase